MCLCVDECRRNCKKSGYRLCTHLQPRKNSINKLLVTREKRGQHSHGTKHTHTKPAVSICAATYVEGKMRNGLVRMRLKCGACYACVCVYVCVVYACWACFNPIFTQDMQQRAGITAHNYTRSTSWKCKCASTGTERFFAEVKTPIFLLPLYWSLFHPLYLTPSARISPLSK